MHEWYEERAHRLGHQHRVGPVADGRDDRVGVLGQPGGLIIGGHLDADRVMSALAKLPLDGMPIPRVPTGTGYQYIAHICTLLHPNRVATVTHR